MACVGLVENCPQGQFLRRVLNKGGGGFLKASPWATMAKQPGNALKGGLEAKIRNLTFLGTLALTLKEK